MVARFDAVRFTGVGRIFSRGEQKLDFSRCSQNYFSKGTKRGKILFYPFETKKTTFFAKNLIGKCQFSNSTGSRPHPATLPTPIFRLLTFRILWTLQPRFTLQLSARTLQCLFEGMCMLQYFRTLLALTKIGFSVLLCSVVPSVTS